jgi:hypothetical protein
MRVKKGVEFFILTTPISLHSQDFSIECALNKTLESMKNLKDFRFMMNKINSSILVVIINKANIVIFLPTDVGVGPHTSK